MSVNHESFGLQNAKESGPIYSSVRDDQGHLIIGRSITQGGDLPLESANSSIDSLKDFSDEARAGLTSSWLVSPHLGGYTGDQNQIILTKETEEQMKHLSDHILEWINGRDDLWLDMQVVPMYHAEEDVIPTYIFVGYRALESDGTPVAMDTWSSNNPLVGDTMNGGSEYQYVAVKNGSAETPLNYSTGEPSNNEQHGGFQQGFDPAVYFGTEDSVVNNEQEEKEINPDDLPPGSSPRFLETAQTEGTDALQLAQEQKNGEAEGANDSSGFGGIIAGILPFLLLGSVLLIAGDKSG